MMVMTGVASMLRLQLQLLHHHLQLQVRWLVMVVVMMVMTGVASMLRLQLQLLHHRRLQLQVR